MVTVHPDDVLRITPNTLSDLNAIRNKLNAALLFLQRPPLSQTQSDSFTNLADATDTLDALGRITGMDYVCSVARSRLLALYTLSASLDAARPSMLEEVLS